MSEIRSGLDGCTGENAAHNLMHLSGKSKEVLEEELALLVESASEEDCDLALIDAYLAALDAIDPVDFGEDDTDAAFLNFQKKHPYYFGRECAIRKGPQSGKRPAVALKWVAAVLVVVLGSSFVVQAAGVDVWGRVLRWTGNVLHFGASRDNEAPSDGYESLQEALDAYAITGPFIPAVLEGYKQEAITVADGLDFTKIQVTYAGEAGEFIYTIRRFQRAEDAENYIFETTQNIPHETYLVGDVEHYILDNNQTMTAMWRTDTVVGVLNGELSDTGVRQFIDSIYKGEE